MKIRTVLISSFILHPSSFQQGWILMLKRIGLLFFLGGCAFVCGAIGIGVLPRTPKVFAEGPALPPVSADSTLQRLSDRFEAAANRVMPAVVSIEAVKPPSPGKTRPLEES